MGDAWFRQEYMCEFIDDGTSDVRAGSGDGRAIVELDGPGGPRRGQWFVGLDLGQKQDFSAVAWWNAGVRGF